MEPLLSRAEARAFDAHAMGALGVPGIVLMENAGAGATRALCGHFAGALERVVCVGGIGQNGGDAWVVARHLVTRGLSPRCVLVGDPARVRGDAAVNLEALRRLGVPLVVSEDPAQVAALAASASVLVDGLFGTGLDRPITGVLAAVVRALDAAAAPIAALDLPSGVDADTGAVLGAALHASLTLTFAASKRGLAQYPGRGFAGEVRVIELGAPLWAPGAAGQITGRYVATRLPRREPGGHKGSHGHVLLFAGSLGTTGAALLAALGAHRAGAGLVTLASDPDTQRALDLKVVETMTRGLTPGDELADALALAQGKAACLVGPGFGLHEPRRALACALAEQLPVPAVLDADALTALADDLAPLTRAKAPRLLTPHPGEAARLLHTDTAAIAADRYGAALELARRAGHVVVLKGAGTVVAAPDGRLAVCTRGTPALGAGGTGDVLAGACTALMAALGPFEAAAAAVELHARAGELCAAAGSDRGVLASEVAAALPKALETCRA